LSISFLDTLVWFSVNKQKQTNLIMVTLNYYKMLNNKI